VKVRRVVLAVAVVLDFLTPPLLGEAQQAQKTVHIGILSAGQTRSSPLYVAFERRLRELGYTDGRNARIEFRGAEGRPERMVERTKELVRLKIDVLLTAGGDATLRAAKETAGSIPIVMVAVDSDPIAGGYVASLAHPGGNMTGIVFHQLALTAKRLQFLKEALPRVTRVAVLWDTSAAAQLAAAEAAAGPLGLQLQPVELRNPPYDFEGAFRTVSQGHADALFVLTTPLIFRERARIAGYAVKSRLPTVFSFREHIEAGGLFSSGVNFSDMFRRAAEYVDRILKGAKPADLPVVQPTKYELVINLKTAKALGLTIPQSLLLRADEVLQ
jgi:putative ABC transport system substrate-binding protein